MLRQQASCRRGLAEDRKELRRDVSGVGKHGAVADDGRGIVSIVVSAVERRHLLEDVVLRLPVEKVGPRHVLAGASGIGPERLDRDEALGVGVRERLKQDRVDHRENGDVGTDGQGEDGARAKREAPAPGQGADRIARVAHEVIEPSRYPRVPHGFLHLGHAAELDARLSSGLGLAQAGLDPVLDAALHVIPQFAIEVPFQPVTPPTEEIQEPGHGSRSLGEDQPHGRRQLVPAGLFERQLLVAGPRE